MQKGRLSLKTVDGVGGPWKPMTSLASLYPTPFGKFHAELSWTGQTLVVYGNDPTAIKRRQFGTAVWKSSVSSAHDGETWTDETGDLATISMGHGRWHESDFYIIMQGEGVIVKRNVD